MATVTTKKHGFEEITGLDSDHFTEELLPNGRTRWTATDAAGEVGLTFPSGRTQAHGGAAQPLKVGSTIEEWTDDKGVTRAIIKRVK